MSNENGFLPALPKSIIERALIAEYLLGKGYLLCDLQFLATDDAYRLYEEACLFARRNLREVMTRVSLTRYSATGFSLN